MSDDTDTMNARQNKWDREDREAQQREDRRLGEQMEKVARWERDHERGCDD